MWRCKLLAIWLFTTVWLLVATRGDARDEDLRTWTDSTGNHKWVAAFQKLEGDSVYLRTKDGKETKVPLEKLSEADQSYARNAAPVDAVPDPFQESAKTPSPAGQAAAEVELDDASHTADPNLRVVVAEGVGTNVEQAKRDAYRDAVRQVVGAYVDSSQLLKNDKLIEDRITTLSSAFVEKASQPLTKVTEDGIVRVKVKAWVRLTKVLETLKQSNVVLKVDNTSFTAEIQTKTDQAEGEEAIMSRVFEAFPANSFKASLVGKPEITKASATNVAIRIGVKFEPDLEQYLLVAQKIEAALGSTGRTQGQFSMDGKAFKPGDDPEQRLAFWNSSGNGVWDLIKRCLPKNDHARLQKEKRPDNTYSSVDVPTQLHFWLTDGVVDLGDKWAKLQESSDIAIFLVMTKSNANGRRTTWKWYVLSKEDAEKWFAPAFKPITCTLTFLNDGSTELLEDSFSLSRLGWDVLNRHNTFKFVYVCSPFFVHDIDDWYAPSFTYTRLIEADTTEIEGLSAVKCSLVNGEIPDKNDLPDRHYRKEPGIPESPAQRRSYEQ